MEHRPGPCRRGNSTLKSLLKSRSFWQNSSGILISPERQHFNSSQITTLGHGGVLNIQLVFVFTVSCQRHSELIPGCQEDLDVFLIPGFQRNCTHQVNKNVIPSVHTSIGDRTCSTLDRLTIGSRVWKRFCSIKNTQLLSPSRLKQLIPWQAGLQTACCQLFYYDISEKEVIRKSVELCISCVSESYG